MSEGHTGHQRQSWVTVKTAYFPSGVSAPFSLTVLNSQVFPVSAFATCAQKTALLSFRCSSWLHNFDSMPLYQLLQRKLGLETKRHVP